MTTTVMLSAEEWKMATKLHTFHTATKNLILIVEFALNDDKERRRLCPHIMSWCGSPISWVGSSGSWCHYCRYHATRHPASDRERGGSGEVIFHSKLGQSFNKLQWTCLDNKLAQNQQPTNPVSTTYYLF